MRFLSAELKMVEGPFCGKGCCSAVACRKAIGLGRNKKRPFVFPWPLTLFRDLDFALCLLKRTGRQGRVRKQLIDE